MNFWHIIFENSFFILIFIFLNILEVWCCPNELTFSWVLEGRKFVELKSEDRWKITLGILKKF